MGVSAYFTPVVGDEVTTKTGHFNAFPFPAGAKPPDPNIADWPDLLRAIRSAPGERVVVLNHPRDLHAGFRPFAPEQFNPVTGEHRRGPLGVDAMEVINSGAMQSDPMRPVRDWMALRNRGERITAVGASDSHDGFDVAAMGVVRVAGQASPGLQRLFAAGEDGDAVPGSSGRATRPHSRRPDGNDGEFLVRRLELLQAGDVRLRSASQSSSTAAGRMPLTL